MFSVFAWVSTLQRHALTGLSALECSLLIGHCKLAIGVIGSLTFFAEGTVCLLHATHRSYQ